MNLKRLNFFIAACTFCICVKDIQAQKVGLVLSGGGARGLAHIGVIKALEENHIPIDFIAGTSAGALVGSMYAQGFSPEEMERLVTGKDFYRWATGELDENETYYFRKKDDNASWVTLKFAVDSGIHTILPVNLVNSVLTDFFLMRNTAPVIAKANYDFDSLFVPFRCVASDVANKKAVVFKEGDLASAVRASMAFPFYFTPMHLDGKLLYDGGLYNNFPADVMLQEFDPDIIIGSSAAGRNLSLSDDNLASQLRVMMTTPTKLDVICENGILIEPATDRFGLFDFSNPAAIIRTGYDATLKKLDEIVNFVQVRCNGEELSLKRRLFADRQKPIAIDKIEVEGLNSRQAEYVKKMIRMNDSLPVSFSSFHSNYFKLVADENIKSIYPTLVYNPASGFYDLKLNVKRQKDLLAQFGGNISSRPISEAFLGLQYNFWSKYSLSINTNFYFGKLFSGGQAKVRFDKPSKVPYYLEAEAGLNQWDFYKSSTDIFSDVRPSFLLQNDYNFGLNFGLPARNKGKVVIGGSYIRLSNRYYQTLDFSEQDTTDKTLFRGGSALIQFERNTLNRKMYASDGTYLNIKLRAVDGREETTPGSTSVDESKVKDHHRWLTLKVTYDNYFEKLGPVRLGFYAENVFSSQPFFANYISSVMLAPSFEPLQEIKTLFLPNYHAHNYIGAGLKMVINPVNNVDIRIEGFAFQPFEPILKDELTSQAYYGDAFSKLYNVFSGSVIYHSPVGPVSVSLNRYNDREKKFSFLFHFGYIIFNRTSLE